MGVLRLIEKQSLSNIVEDRDDNEISNTEEEIPDYDLTMKNFNDGDVITGRIVKIDRDEVLLDVGYKSEGVIPSNELSVKKDVNPEEVVSLGDEIEALVLQKEDSEGRLILSKKRAEQNRAWDKLIQLRETDGCIKGKVIEVVRGGLILDIGLRGFLPASLVDLKRVKDLESYVGQELECKIVEMDRNRNNVVLSRKAAMESVKQGKLKEILSSLKKDQILEGTISSIVNFGAFVDLNGVDGLIHVSELSWDHISHPSEVVSVGDKVKVKILDVNLERERISLGYKQTQTDPWRDRISKFSIGLKVKGKVSRLAGFGVFVRFDDDMEGLVHISELSSEHIESPEEVVKPGDEIEVKIIDIDYDKRRISLSLKEACEEETKVEQETVSVQKEEDKDIALNVSGHTEIQDEEPEEIKTEDKVNYGDKPKGEKETKKETKEKTGPSKKIAKSEERNQLKSSSELNDLSLETSIGKEPESLESILEDMKKKSGHKKKEPLRELKREENQAGSSS